MRLSGCAHHLAGVCAALQIIWQAEKLQVDRRAYRSRSRSKLCVAVGLNTINFRPAFSEEEGELPEMLRLDCSCLFLVRSMAECQTYFSSFPFIW